MNYFETTIEYILDAGHWTGAMGLGTLTAQHVGYSLLGVGLSALIGVPLGWWVGHTGKGRGLAVVVSGAVRALPTLGLITLFGLALGIGLRAPLLALVILALPSVLAGAYTGIEAADRGRHRRPRGWPDSRSSPRRPWRPTPVRAGWADSCSSGSRRRTTP